MMHITTVTVGPFEENCYIVADASSGDAVLIDPGEEGARILALAADAGARPREIWLTHAHLDHIGGIAAVRATCEAPIRLHPLDEPLYRIGRLQAEHYGVPFDDPPPTDHALAEGDVLAIGALRFTVMHVPGHAPGHVAFHGHGVVFGGDCLFAGSIGRTDLPFSNGADLEVSLERLAALPPETAVYPGHGPATTIATELRNNPFLSGVARIAHR